MRFLFGVNVFILPTGIGKNRLEFFRQALDRHGARDVDENSPDLADVLEIIVLFDENTLKSFASIEKAMMNKRFYLDLRKHPDRQIRFIKSLWLSECLKQKKFVELDRYQVNDDQSILENKNTEKNSNQPILDAVLLKSNLVNEKRTNADSDEEKYEKPIKRSKLEFDPNSSSYSETESESDTKTNGFENVYLAGQLKTKSHTLLNSKEWTCARSSKEQTSQSPNLFVIKKLEEMSTIYESTRDKYRAFSYQKAIIAIKRLSRSIQSREEILAIPGIGSRLADRIWEIVQTGDLKKLDYLKSRDDIASVELFTTVHGIGPATAQNFVAQGFRTLDDLHNKANLTRQQKIGLKYHHDFLQRISRAEVVKIEAAVKEAALSINSGLVVVTCGSYRRGKPTCGDVDILITHPDGYSHKKVFNKLIEKLHETGFLSDDLIMQDEDSTDSQRKYLGVCKLEEKNSIHRRIDIIVVPYDEYACALIYFTGSAHFVRSMRHLARKLGLSLSEKSLNRNVIRVGNEKVNEGERILTPNEESVFKYLNIPYRTPEERDF